MKLCVGVLLVFCFPDKEPPPPAPDGEARFCKVYKPERFNRERDSKETIAGIEYNLRQYIELCVPKEPPK